MSKPVTAQQLIDWINAHVAYMTGHPGLLDMETEEILTACKAFLEALEEKP